GPLRRRARRAAEAKPGADGAVSALHAAIGDARLSSRSFPVQGGLDLTADSIAAHLVREPLEHSAAGPISRLGPQLQGTAYSVRYLTGLRLRNHHSRVADHLEQGARVGDHRHASLQH